MFQLLYLKTSSKQYVPRLTIVLLRKPHVIIPFIATIKSPCITPAFSAGELLSMELIRGKYTPLVTSDFTLNPYCMWSFLSSLHAFSTTSVLIAVTYYGYDKKVSFPFLSRFRCNFRVLAMVFQVSTSSHNSHFFVLYYFFSRRIRKTNNVFSTFRCFMKNSFLQIITDLSDPGYNHYLVLTKYCIIVYLRV